MAGNLFFLRGWSITLIAAIFALSVKDSQRGYIVLAYFPVGIFWILDGYFLSQERLFRALYDDVRKKKPKDIDFSMNTTKYTKDKKNGVVYTMLSKTLAIFYLPLIGIMVLVSIFLL